MQKNIFKKTEKESTCVMWRDRFENRNCAWWEIVKLINFISRVLLLPCIWPGNSIVINIVEGPLSASLVGGMTALCSWWCNVKLLLCCGADSAFHCWLSSDVQFGGCGWHGLATMIPEVELSWVESGYLYAAPNSLFSRNGAGRWFTHAGKAESSAGAWRCSATVRGLVAKEVDCSRLRVQTPRSSAGQWKSELWARERFQSLQSAIGASPRLKWPECSNCRWQFRFSGCISR